MTEKPAPTKEELQAYWDKLNNFDWFYDFSDDHRVWTNGEKEKAKLLAKAGGHPEFQALYDGWRKHMFSGKAWLTEKAPKPARPE